MRSRHEQLACEGRDLCRSANLSDIDIPHRRLRRQAVETNIGERRIREGDHEIAPRYRPLHPLELVSPNDDHGIATVQHHALRTAFTGLPNKFTQAFPGVLKPPTVAGPRPATGRTIGLFHMAISWLGRSNYNFPVAAASAPFGARAMGYNARSFRLAPWLAAALILALCPAAAQTYPTQPIKIIVATAPAGLADLVARTLAQKLSAS